MQQAKLALTPSPTLGTIPSVGARRSLVVLALFILMSMATLITTVFTPLWFTERELVATPFLAYSDIFPGQLWSSVLANRFSCSQVTLPSWGDLYDECLYRPQTGPFSYVDIMIWDGIVTYVDFTVRENALTVGNLWLWWGDTDYISGDKMVVMRWPELDRIAIVSIPYGHYSYLSPVHQVSFTMEGRVRRSYP